MAELVDALDSKSGGSNTVRVRFPLRPPNLSDLHKIWDSFFESIPSSPTKSIFD